MQAVDQHSPSDQINTELSARRTGMSFQRTRMSADRTLMSVIRTALSLISFGFTIYQVFQKLRDAEAHSGSKPEAVTLSKFFALHYGIFTAVHGLLVLVFFGLVMGGLWQQGQAWWLSAIIIAAIHYLGFRSEWRARQGWTRTTPGRVMAEPYARVLVLHVIVIAGGWLALSAPSPQSILKLFALIKLGVELIAAFIWSRFALKKMP